MLYSQREREEEEVDGEKILKLKAQQNRIRVCVCGKILLIWKSTFAICAPKRMLMFYEYLINKYSE